MGRLSINGSDRNKKCPLMRAWLFAFKLTTS
jgi:hypothetical protein